MVDTADFPIVFLTGLGFLPNNMFEFFQKINSSSQLIVPAYPDSTKVRGLSDILCYFEEKIPENAVIVGWSLGGAIGKMIFEQSRKEFAKLITVSSNFRFMGSVDWPGIAENDFSDFLNLAFTNFNKLYAKFEKLVFFPDVRKNNNVMSRSFMKNDFMFYLDVLKAIDCRNKKRKYSDDVLYIFSDKDAIVPAKVAQDVSRYGLVKVLNNAGHMPFYSHEDELVKMIRTFLYGL